MKKKLFINQDSGYLMIDIVNAHVKAGYQCTLITGRLIQHNTPLHKEVKTEHIVAYNRSSNFKRIYTWLVAGIQILYKVILKYRDTELFIVSNPPIAPLLPLWTKNPFSLLIFDIYPDTLVTGKIISDSSLIAKWWKNANKRVYRKAANIYTLTERMGEVLKQYTTDKQPVVVSVWTDSNFLKPITKAENSFIKYHGLQGKFIVMYSGNLGFTHNIQVLAEIAARVKNPAILFVIIGDGDEKTALKEKIKELKLTNCIMLPWQPTSELPNSLAAADLAIVSSGSGVANLSIPSKTYNLMSVGAPLLCLAPEGSELCVLVQKHKIGQSFEPHQLELIVTYINQLVNNPDLKKQYSNNALKASLMYSSENARLFL